MAEVESNQGVVDRIRTTSAPITGTGTLWAWGRINTGAALTGWVPGTATPTVTASPTTSTSTRTPTVTSTATATATPTQVASPTLVACPSPRPPVRLAPSATGTKTFGVTVRAGAGVVRVLDFREMRNASITIGGQRDVSTPFVYRASSYSPELSFSAMRPNDAEAWIVSFVVTDDCGSWPTFVGGGPGYGPYGNPTPSSASP